MPSQPRRNWTRQDTLIAFRLYCRTPFGKLHKGNPEIIDLSQRLGRTPSAVGMKACNFASLDPEQQNRGITALANTSSIDDQIWEEFETNPEAVAAEAEAAYERLLIGASESPLSAFVEGAVIMPQGPTEIDRVVRTRRVQGFFRDTVLTSYGFRCSLTGLDVPELLNASHIIPWATSVERRADPRNGLCLNVILDRAFDRGLIAFNDDLTVIVSSRLTRHHEAGGILVPGGLVGRRLNPPSRFDPDPRALEYHRTTIFQH